MPRGSAFAEYDCLRPLFGLFGSRDLRNCRAPGYLWGRCVVTHASPCLEYSGRLEYSARSSILPRDRDSST